MKDKVKKITLSALFIAMGIVLPFLTAQIPQIGSMLLPMHIPVFFCGLICGWQYGAAVGFILPLFRSLMLQFPPMYPNAIAMAPELLTYGLIAGLVYSLFKRQGIAALYTSLIIAMISGRIVWGLAEVIILGIDQTAFSLEAFMAGAFINAIPGVIIQLILIPAVMAALNKTGIVKFKRPV